MESKYQKSEKKRENRNTSRKLKAGSAVQQPRLRGLWLPCQPAFRGNSLYLTQSLTCPFYNLTHHPLELFFFLLWQQKNDPEHSTGISNLPDSFLNLTLSM